jgi:MFS family permease
MFHLRYFSNKVSRGFVSIYSSRIILGISSALLGLFMPIFLYEIFHLSLKSVIIYYFLDYFVYFLIIIPGTKLAVNILGLNRSMVISSFFGASHYLMLFLVSSAVSSGKNFWPFLILAVIFINIYRFLYWVPVHTDLSKFTDRKNRTKEMSFLQASLVFFNAIIPVFSGWLLMQYGYNVLFILAILIFTLSSVPLLSLEKTDEKYDWTYRRAWKEFFSKKRRRTVLAYAGDGAETIISEMIWPIFIWSLLQGDYLQVGLISSLVVAATVLMQLFVGRAADNGKNNKLLKYGTIFYSLGWIIKMFISTAFQIFVVSTYHNLTRAFTRAPFDALNYQRAADQGHYVDEYTSIKEMALAAGKCAILVLILFLAPFFELTATFILAALATLLLNLLIEDDDKEGERALLI